MWHLFPAEETRTGALGNLAEPRMSQASQACLLVIYIQPGAVT